MLIEICYVFRDVLSWNGLMDMSEKAMVFEIVFLNTRKYK
jgi:hypothetical protein